MKLRSQRGLRGLLCFAWFMAGLGGVCWAIREALPFPEVPQVTAKIDYLAKYRDDFDTLFLGSSRIYYQIIPALFDRVAAEQGLPVRSFNAGVAGMRPPEDAFYLDTILRHPPKNLRWVFIELAGVWTKMDPSKAGTVRAIYWHDWPRLRVLFDRALTVKPDSKKKRWRRNLEDRLEPLGEFIDHLPLFFQRQTSLGRGSLLTSLLISDLPVRPYWGALGEDRRGWVPTGRAESMSAREVADYEEFLAERRARKPRREVGDPASLAALETMIAKIEKLGATPVLVVPPTTNKRNFVPRPERERKTIVLDFCDLEKFPELYEARCRLDTDHLNTEGSQVFTRILVNAWAQEVKRRQ